MSAVCTVQDLVRKYGTKTIGLVVGRFIAQAPEFDGDGELARELGVMMADLESALMSVSTVGSSVPLRSESVAGACPSGGEHDVRTTCLKCGTEWGGP